MEIRFFIFRYPNRIFINEVFDFLIYNDDNNAIDILFFPPQLKITRTVDIIISTRRYSLQMRSNNYKQSLGYNGQKHKYRKKNNGRELYVSFFIAYKRKYSSDK